jgi:hypothetical protein
VAGRRQLGIHRDALRAAFCQWGLPALARRVGWQPSRFLADRSEAERAFALAERLGSVNAAAQELDTTWPSLRKAFHPARPRDAGAQPRGRPPAGDQRGPPAHGPAGHPSLDPVFVALNHGELPVRARSGRELAERVRRAEEYVLLGARVVVELHSESYATKPSTRAWAITRRAQRAHRRHAARQQRGEQHQAGQAERTSRPQPEREMVADVR